jgi:ABC-2 type transport system ATP-binding protein
MQSISPAAGQVAALPDDDPVVRVRGLVKRYGDLVAVDGIDFDVARGEVFALLGPNGAGKTTTVEILEGLRAPDAGTATVLGVDVATGADRIKPRIGVSLQTAALYPKLTVTELIDLFGSFYPKARPANELIDLLELGERRDARTQELSGGQRQRLSVALALVNDPELIFLDEPTTGLDPAARRALWDLVLDLKAKGRTVVLTTHYLEEAEILCDRVAIMDHGHILEMGTVDELVGQHFQDRAVRFDATEDFSDDELSALPAVSSIKRDAADLLVYTRDVGATIGALLALADAKGVEAQNLTVRRATLEDVFLDLTGRALRD